MKGDTRKRLFSGIVLLLLIAATLLPVPSSATTYPLTVTDDLGRNITISKEPERIISLAPSNTEILFALGLGDKIVGVTDYCDYPPEAQSKEKIGGPWTPNIEKIVALEPDLILAAGVNPISVIEELEHRGLTVFGIEAVDLDDLLNDIGKVGLITNREDEAEELIEEMRERIEAVEEKTEGLSPAQRPRTVHIMWHNPIWTSGRGTFIHDLIERAGGTNVFADLQGYKSVTLEELIQRDPEVIIVTAMGGAGSGTWKWVLTEPRLAGISARQTGRIYYVESSWVERPGPRIVLGLEQVAKYIHPEIFFNPWDYDRDGSRRIEKSDAIRAVQDYFNGLIAKMQALQVLALYFA
jgi:iron complex transport system substrate-binding protein